MHNILVKMFLFCLYAVSLYSVFRLKELFQVKNGLTTSLLFFGGGGGGGKFQKFGSDGRWMDGLNK